MGELLLARFRLRGSDNTECVLEILIDDHQATGQNTNRALNDARIHIQYEGLNPFPFQTRLQEG
tara:strand:+ start:1349 stop:1540 length:192 start_codon:yes stop_codon:yes gene_type:complete